LDFPNYQILNYINLKDKKTKLYDKVYILAYGYR
jgi:hypothetical protein